MTGCYAQEGSLRLYISIIDSDIHTNIPTYRRDETHPLHIGSGGYQECRAINPNDSDQST